MKVGKLFVLTAMILATSCSMPGQMKAVGGEGQVIVSLAKSSLARTVVADFSTAAATLVVTLTSKNGFPPQSATVTLPATTTTFASVPVGTWDVSATAENSARQTVGLGTMTGQSVTASAALNVNLGISFTQTGSGGYRLTIAFPQAAGFDSVSGALLNAAGTPVGSTATFSSSSTPTLTSTLSGTNFQPIFSQSGIHSGAYSLILTFFNANSKMLSSNASLKSMARGALSSGGSGSPLVFVEAINIWDNQTSSLWINPSGAVVPIRTFSDTDLADDSSLAGLVLTNSNSALPPPQLTPTFSSGTVAYQLTGLDLVAGGAFTATGSSAGQVISVSPDNLSWYSVTSGSPYGINAPGPGQTYYIQVTSANGLVSQTYTLTASSSTTTVTTSTPTPIAANVVTVTGPASVSRSSPSATFAGAYTGTTASNAWALDGIDEGGLDMNQSSVSFDITNTGDPNNSILSLGQHYITIYALDSTSGVTYSGSFNFTVTN